MRRTARRAVHPSRSVIVLSLLLLGCRGDGERGGAATAEPGTPALEQAHVLSDSATKALCSGTTPSDKCAQAVDAGLVQPMEGTIARSDRRLRIALENGDSLVLVDSVGDHPDGVWHTYRGLLAAVGYHVIELQFYEGGGFLLVNRRTGWSTRSYAVPTVSPDSTRLAAGSVDLEAEFSPTLLQIWRVSAETLAVEFEHDFMREATHPDSVWGPRRIEWVTPTELRMTREYSFGEVGGKARALFGTAGWRIAPE